MGHPELQPRREPRQAGGRRHDQDPRHVRPDERLALSRLDALLARAAADAAGLRDAPSARVAFVTCGYDTAFEPVADQVAAKVEELREAFGEGGVDWSLWVVDDQPGGAFGAGVDRGFGRAPGLADRLHRVPLTGGAPTADGLKGRALLDGMAAALAAGADAVVYINLNLKVRALFAASGLRALLAGECDAAIGTRAPELGGVVVGAGPLGRLKSRAYSRIARSLLPPLADFVDTNGPLKAFTAEAAGHLVRHARLDHASLDCEWLMLMHAGGFRMAQFPVAWVQRAGSRPPWHLVAMALRDAARLRRRWRAGGLPARHCGTSPTITR